MKRTVYKFPLDLKEVSDGISAATIKVGFECRLLDVAKDGGLELCAWYQVLLEHPTPTLLQRIWFVGTGREVPAGVKFVKTLHSNPYVWHIFQS